MGTDPDDTARLNGRLRELLERHPRATWPRQRQRSASVALWLDVHDGLRRECAALQAAADDYRAGRTSAPPLAARTAPRLHGMLAELKGHHETEDFHYFPALRERHPQLAGGFDALAGDHSRLERAMADAAHALGLLLAASTEGADPSAARHAAERFVATGAELTAGLGRHLADEEDLVIPLLLDLEKRDDFG